MKIISFILLFVPILLFPITSVEGQVNMQVQPTDGGTLNVDLSLSPAEPVPGDTVDLVIDFINPTTQKTQEHIDYQVMVTKDNMVVFDTAQFLHTSLGKVTIPVEFKEEGMYKAQIDINGILFQPIALESVAFDILVDESTSSSGNDKKDNGGGCLVATAAFGSEIAPQVQQLREIRNNVIMQTESGALFMNGFNQIYYLFSPGIADIERQNPIFKEMVKITIMPMLSSFAILNNVEIDSEADMIVYGTGIILLNIGMYVGIPAFLALKFYDFKRK